MEGRELGRMRSQIYSVVRAAHDSIKLNVGRTTDTPGVNNMIHLSLDRASSILDAPKFNSTAKDAS